MDDFSVFTDRNGVGLVVCFSLFSFSNEWFGITLLQETVSAGVRPPLRRKGLPVTPAETNGKGATDGDKVVDAGKYFRQ